MGRVLLYVLMVALVLFVLSAAFLIQSGGGSSQSAMEVSVHDLSLEPDAYAREQVASEGVLRRIMEPEEHFLVTAEGLGIVVRGYSAEELRRLEGQTVTVTGKFGFDRDAGTYIEAENVTPLDQAPAP